MKVVCYATPHYARARYIAKAMHAGFHRHGIRALYTEQKSVQPADVVIAYGWRHEQFFRRYQAKGAHFVYIDLGYWARKPVHNKYEGYHKVAVDDWSPTVKMRRGCPADRFQRLGLDLKPSTGRGDAILVAGMSGKGAAGHHLPSEQWERAAIATLKAYTDRPIIYRPKPSWEGAKPIEGTIYSGPEETIDDVLKRTHLVVTHHSNVGIDALVAGVPVYCEAGAPALLSTKRMIDIEAPRIPTLQERHQLMCDLAYTQWQPREMRKGECWEYIRGLIT